MVIGIRVPVAMIVTLVVRVLMVIGIRVPVAMIVTLVVRVLMVIGIRVPVAMIARLVVRVLMVIGIRVPVVMIARLVVRVLMVIGIRVPVAMIATLVVRSGLSVWKIEMAIVAAPHVNRPARKIVRGSQDVTKTTCVRQNCLAALIWVSYRGEFARNCADCLRKRPRWSVGGC
jgi:hypothetical protein